MSKRIKVGAATAYGIAKAHGYTGTEEEWNAEQMTLRNEARSYAQQAAQTLVNAGNLIRNEGSAQIKAIEEKGADTLATIPGDYTALVDRVTDLAEEKASPILMTVSGTELDMPLSADRELREFHLFGKCEQEAGPTLDSPKEISEIGDTTVTITADGVAKTTLLTIPNGLHSIGDVRDELIVNSDGSGKIIRRIGYAKLRVGDMNNTVSSYPGWKNLEGMTTANMNSMNKAFTADQYLCSIASGEFKVYGNTGLAALLLPQAVFGLSYSEWLEQYPDLEIQFAWVYDIQSEETLTAEQVSALYTRKPSSVLTTDTGAEMEAIYIADTKNYVDVVADDLAALAERVESDIDGNITATTHTETGTILSVTDAAEAAFRELTIYGATTVDGTPSALTPATITGVNPQLITFSDEDFVRKSIAMNLEEPLYQVGDLKDELILNSDGSAKIIRRNAHVKLAVADMNNNESYPGWNGVANLYENWPEKELFTDGGYCNICTISGRNVIPATTGNRNIIYLDTSVWGMTQSVWKETYPDLVVEIVYPTVLEREETLTFEQVKMLAGENIIANAAEAEMKLRYVVDMDLRTENLTADMNRAVSASQAAATAAAASAESANTKADSAINLAASTAANVSTAVNQAAEALSTANAASETAAKALSGAAFDYKAYKLPCIEVTGDTSAMTKETKVTLEYCYTTWDGDTATPTYGTCSMKWQGSSSIKYAKKNFTITFDNAFEAVEGWGEQKKYCLKANWVDFSHMRNIVSAKLWGKVRKSREDALDPRLSALPNAGAIDGFPCILFINGEYWGLYSMNIPKDKWMFGMSKDEDACIFTAENHTPGTRWKELPTLDTESGSNLDFEVEHCTDGKEDTAIALLNNAIQAAIDGGSDFRTTVGQYVDIDSAIDYLIFASLLTATDGMDKNYILASFGLEKLFFSAYDLDTTFGMDWDGKRYYQPKYGNATIAHFAQVHRLMELIVTYDSAALKARYNSLRTGVLSESRVHETFMNYLTGIPFALKVKEHERWPGIPGTCASEVGQILENYRLRCELLDGYIAAL